MRSTCIALALSLAIAGFALPAAATSNPDDVVTEKAPVFKLLIDASTKSPGTNPQLMQSIWPSIEAKMRRLPIGTTVIVSTMGDPSEMPMIWRTRVQAKSSPNGAPLQAVIRSVKNVVLTFPEEIKGKEHKKSHLITALFQATRQLNPKSQDNAIVMITDLIEYSPLANCSPPNPCKLPKPEFSLKGIDIHVYGSVDRMSPRQAMVVLKAWEEFLKKAGVELELVKTM